MSEGGKPWLHHLESVTNNVDSGYEELHNIWAICGYEDDTCEQRRNTVVNHINQLISEMVKEEMGHKNHLLAKVEDALKEIVSLGKELRCNISTTGYENLPLNKMEKALRNLVVQYRKVKQDRQNKLTELKEQEQRLCSALGIEPSPIIHQIPTEEELENFRQSLFKREQEKVQLENIFRQKRLEILALVEELEWAPSLQFEKNVIDDDGTSFTFSEANMKNLEDFYRRLDEELSERKTLISELQAKLTELWDRLSQDIKYRQNFLSTLRGYGLKTVDRMKNEISRLEDIKRQNVKKFVEFTRKDLEDWWRKCYISEQQRQLFVSYYSNCYTEDLLELHELEVQKMKNFYESNINIFVLVKQRQDLWDKMLDIENKSHDKNRLFGNRGGQLLQEERERKRIQKELPKIEANLLEYLKVYETEHRTPFLLNGEVLSEVIKKQWKEHEDNKEQEKKARKLRDQESAIESRYGSRSVTKDSAGKRKRCPTPTSTAPALKHAKLTPGTTPCSSVSRSGKIQRTREGSTRIKKAVRKSLRLSGPSAQGPSGNDGMLAREMSIASTALSYTRFEGQFELLTTKSDCRSSVKPEILSVTPGKPPRRALTPRNFDTPRMPASQSKMPSLKQLKGSTSTATPRFGTPRVKLPVIF